MIVGGSLVMNTLVGIAAITGMLMRGESAVRIVAQLPQSPALAVFAAMGGLLMSLIGGYTAATIAKTAPIWHAVSAGVVSIAVTLALTPLWDDTASLGFTALLAVAILPCAVFGAWLAQPVEKAKAERYRRELTSGLVILAGHFRTCRRLGFA